MRTSTLAGIGKAIVEEFAKLGASVYTCCRSQDGLDTALAAWQDAGLQVQGCVADVSTEEGRGALVSSASACFGGAHASA